MAEAQITYEPSAPVDERLHPADGQLRPIDERLYSDERPGEPAGRHARLGANVINTEIRVLEGLRNTALTYKEYWLDSRNISVKSRMRTRARNLGAKLNPQYRELESFIDRRLKEIDKEWDKEIDPEDYYPDKGIDHLNDYYDSWKAIRRPWWVDYNHRPRWVSADANDPYYGGVISPLNDTIDKLSEGRVELANRARAFANWQEKHRLFAIRLGINRYLRGAGPHEGDLTILDDYDEFLYKLLQEIEERLRRICRPGDIARTDYSIAEGMRFFHDMELTLDREQEKLEALKFRAQEVHKNKFNPIGERRIENNTVKAVNHIRRNVYKDMKKQLADGHDEIASLEPSVSRALASNRWYSRERMRAGFRRAADRATSRVGIFAISTGVSFGIKMLVGAGLGPGLIVLPIAGAIGGAAAYMVRTKLSGEQFNIKSLAFSAALGAGGSLLGYGLGEMVLDGWHNIFGSYVPAPPDTVVPGIHPPGALATPPTLVPSPTEAPIHTSLGDTQELLRHVPSSVHLSDHVQTLVDKATSSSATVHDVLAASKEVSFAEINLPGHDVGSAKYGYALIHDGWNCAQDNDVAGDVCGKQLGLDWAYAQDIGAPGVPPDHQSAMDLVRELGTRAHNAWMNHNPWRAGLNIA